MAAPFVIPSVYTAVDKTAPAYRSMATSVRSFASIAETSAMRANRSLAKIGSTADGIFNKIVNMRSALAAGIVIGGAVKLFKMTADVAAMGDELATTAGRIGITTQAYQELSYAAKLQNIEQESLTKSFEKLNKNLGDLHGNQGSLFSALKKSNPTLLKQLKHVKDGEQAFTLISAAIMKLPNQMQRASLAQAAFGKAGQEMLNLIQEGPEALTAMREQARRLNIVLSDETIAAAKKFDDAHDNMNAAMLGLKMTIGGGLMPQLEKYMVKATEWITTHRELIKEKVAEYADKIKNAIIFLTENIDKIILGVKIFTGTLITLKAIALLTTAATYGMQAALFAYNVALGISTALQGKSAFYVMGSKVAYVAYRAVVLATTAAQWLWSIAVGAFSKVAIVATAVQWAWNAAMAANPIGLIIIAIAGLIALIAAVIVKWDSWGQVLAIFLGPLGMVISLIQSFRRNWDLIVKAFKEGGIVEGLKMIGKTILDAILAPLQKVLEIAAKLPGIGGMFGFAAKKIEAFREGMGVNMEGNNTEAAPTPRLSTQAEQNRINTERIEKTERSTMDITVNDKTGNAKVKTSPNAPPVRLTPTVGAFGGNN